jgi:hypothetical protein
MHLTSREAELVRLVAEFKQLTTGQIKRLAFPDVTRRVMHNALAKLKAGRYLRVVGGWMYSGRHGQPADVYQPGDKGWALAKTEAHLYRKVHPHFVWTAEAYTQLVEAQRRGEFTMPRPRLEVVLGSIRADMAVEVTLPGMTEPTHFYVEVEVCDKSRDYVRRKLAAYVAAWARATDVFPYVVVVLPDEDQVLEVAALVWELGEDGELFRVCAVDELVATIRAS